MYQNIFIDKKENITYLWDDVKGLLKFPFRNYAYRKSSNGTYRSIYGDKLEKIYNFNPRDPSLFESDVPMETRILIDAYEDSDEPSKGHRVVTIDIEVSSEGGFPVVEEGDKEITAIAIHDDATKQYTVFILDKEMKIQDSINDNVEIKSYDNEESLLMHFFTKWEEIQPTIVTGWNIDGFDMVYLYNRAKRVVGETNAKRLSSIGICYFNKFLERMTIAGVSCLDYMILYKKFSGKNEPSYALGAIGKKVVNIEKISYKGSLNDLYKDDINRYIEYNLNDVKIVVALDKKLQFIDLARGICHTGHVGYENFGMSSRFLEGAILIYLRRKKQVAPNKSLEGRAEYENQLEQNEEGFEGAYVKDPIPGRYDWVFDLDLTSMYPNIIISLNISPETKVGKVENWNVEEYVKNNVTTLYIGGNPYTVDEFKSLLSENNLSVASNGVLYKKPEPSGDMGTVPSILVKWFDERKNLRKLAKKHADLKEWEKYEFYDNRQKIQKILLNSIYGCLGLPVFRFYDKDNAEAVTLTGVDIIKTAGKSINQYYKNVLKEDGDYLIYTDTDSCFASALPIIQKTMPEIDLKDEEQMTKSILQVCGEVQSFVNQMFNIMADRMFNVQVHRFDAKQEVIAKTSFWLAKKRYCQFIINKGGVVCDELEVKGIDVVRTSFPAKFRSFMQEFLIDLLKKADKETIDQKILDFKENIKNLNIVDIAKNTSVKFESQDKTKSYDNNKRQPFKFLSGTPAQAKAALAYNDLLVKWNLVKSVPKILHGQKIKWVYLKQNEYGIEGIAMKADGTDPDQIMDFITKYVDREAMYEQELKSKLVDFYSVLKWDYPNENDAKASEFFGF
jgi:DNA polymerase elongation subunit (family B)